MPAKLVFIILPGFAPDAVPTLPLQRYLQQLGYATIASNFWGDGDISDFSGLTTEQCLAGIRALVTRARSLGDYVVGVGISLGGALLIEHAKQYQGLDYIVSIGTPFKLRWRKLITLAFFVYPLFYPLWRRLQRVRPLRLTPIGCGRSAVEFLEGRFLTNLSAVRAPVHFLHSRTDPIADYRAVGGYAQHMVNANVRVDMFSSGGHAMGYDAKVIMQRVLDGLPGA